MTFNQVHKHNDWGNYYYDFTEGGTSRTANADPRLKVGAMVNVKFPDGQVISKTIQSKPHTSHVSDMGHQYTVGTKLLGVKVAYLGITNFVPLEALMVEV